MFLPTDFSYEKIKKVITQAWFENAESQLDERDEHITQLLQQKEHTSSTNKNPPSIQ